MQITDTFMIGCQACDLCDLHYFIAPDHNRVRQALQVFILQQGAIKTDMAYTDPGIVSDCHKEIR